MGEYDYITRGDELYNKLQSLPKAKTQKPGLLGLFGKGAMSELTMGYGVSDEPPKLEGIGEKVAYGAGALVGMMPTFAAAAAVPALAPARIAIAAKRLTGLTRLAKALHGVGKTYKIADKAGKIRKVSKLGMAAETAAKGARTFAIHGAAHELPPGERELPIKERALARVTAGAKAMPMGAAFGAVGPLAGPSRLAQIGSAAGMGAGLTAVSGGSTEDILIQGGLLGALSAGHIGVKDAHKFTKEVAKELDKLSKKEREDKLYEILAPLGKERQEFALERAKAAPSEEESLREERLSAAYDRAQRTEPMGVPGESPVGPPPRPRKPRPSMGEWIAERAVTQRGRIPSFTKLPGEGIVVGERPGEIPDILTAKGEPVSEARVAATEEDLLRKAYSKPPFLRNKDDRVLIQNYERTTGAIVTPEGETFPIPRGPKPLRGPGVAARSAFGMRPKSELPVEPIAAQGEWPGLEPKPRKVIEERTEPVSEIAESEKMSLTELLSAHEEGGVFNVENKEPETTWGESCKARFEELTGKKWSPDIVRKIDKEVKLKEVSEKVKAQTPTMLKESDKVNDVTLGTLVKHATKNPEIALKHAADATVSKAKLIEGLKNKGLKAMGEAKTKEERAEIKKNLEETLRRIEEEKPKTEYEARIAEEDADVTRAIIEESRDERRFVEEQKVRDNFYNKAAKKGNAAQASDIIGGGIDRLADDVKRGRIEEKDALSMLEDAVKKNITIPERLDKFKKLLKEKPVIKIPELKNTEDALTFGKTAIPEQVEALKAKRVESETKSNALKDKGDLQGAMDEAVRGQLFREAIESAEGKIVEPEKAKEPVAKISEKEPWETSDLASTPNLSINRITAKKQADGKFRLFFTGTRNEVFEDEEFASAPEARQFFKVQQVKAQEALKKVPVADKVTGPDPGGERQKIYDMLDKELADLQARGVSNGVSARVTQANAVEHLKLDGIIQRYPGVVKRALGYLPELSIETQRMELISKYLKEGISRKEAEKKVSAELAEKPKIARIADKLIEWKKGEHLASPENFASSWMKYDIQKRKAIIKELVDRGELPTSFSKRKISDTDKTVIASELLDGLTRKYASDKFKVKPELLSETKSRLLENIKSEKGSSELINDLSRLGADAIKRGYKSFKAFAVEMKTILGEAWTKVKHLMQRAYAGSKKILASEKGAWTIKGKKEEARAKESVIWTMEEVEKRYADVLKGKPKKLKTGILSTNQEKVSEDAKKFSVAIGTDYVKTRESEIEWERSANRIIKNRLELLETIKKASGGKEKLSPAEERVILKLNDGAYENFTSILKEGNLENINEKVKAFQDGLFKTEQDMGSGAGRSLRALRRVKDIKIDVGKAFAGLEREIREQDVDMYNAAVEASKTGDYKPMASFIKYLKKTEADPKLMDYVYEYWYNCILSGVPTHVVNVASNTTWAAWQVGVHRPLLAAIDPIVAKFQKRPTEYYLDEIVPMLAGIRKGFKPGKEAAKEIMTKGYTTEASMDKWALDMGKTIGAFARSPNKYLRQIAPFLTIPTKALRAMDVWANQMSYQAELGAICKRMEKQGKGKFENLMQNPTEAMQKEAAEFAAYTTFMDEPGKITKWIEKGRNVIPGGRFVVPFVRTIANLTKRGVEMTPGLGIVLGRKAAGREVTQIVVKQIEGAMIATALASMVADDRITGDVPTNKAEREAFYRQGKLPWAIKIGDKWRQYRRLEPFNGPIAAVAIAHDAWKKTGETPSTELAVQSTMGVVNNILDSSYLSGLTRVLDSVRKADTRPQKITNMFDKTIASFSPMSSFQRSFVRAFEAMEGKGAVVRKPKGIAETIKAATPGISKEVAARKNIWGEEVVIPGSPLEQWLPWKAAKPTKDIVELEIERLHGKVGLPYPGMPAKYMTVRGERIDFTDEQYDQLIVEGGQIAKKRLDKLVGTGYWKTMSDKEKTARIKRVIADSRKKARNKLKRELGGKVTFPGAKLRHKPKGFTPAAFTGKRFAGAAFKPTKFESTGF